MPETYQKIGTAVGERSLLAAGAHEDRDVGGVLSELRVRALRHADPVDFQARDDPRLLGEVERLILRPGDDIHRQKGLAHRREDLVLASLGKIPLRIGQRVDVLLRYVLEQRIALQCRSTRIFSLPGNRGTQLLPNLLGVDGRQLLDEQLGDEQRRASARIAAGSHADCALRYSRAHVIRAVPGTGGKPRVRLVSAASLSGILNYQWRGHLDLL